MSLATNIVTRGRVYYARVAVPIELQDQLGRREIWKSLGTTDPREARVRAVAVVAKLRGEWQDLQRPAGELDLRRAAVAFYDRELELDGRSRTNWPNRAEIDAAEGRLREELARKTVVPFDKRARDMAAHDAGATFTALRGRAALEKGNRAFLLKELRDHLGTGETAYVAWAADEAIARDRLKIDPGSPVYKDLCMHLTRAWIQALERAEERDRGRYDGKPTDPIVEPVAGVARVVAAPGESVTEQYVLYAQERAEKLTADTLVQNRKIIDLFVGHVGNRFPASQIDKKAVREWKALLMAFPVKAAEIKVFQGEAIADIVKLNRTARRPTLTPRTVNKYLSALGAFCGWLVSQGHLGANPVDGLYLPLDRDTPKVHPYGMDDLCKIFASPLFTGCESSALPHRRGQVRIRDHRYWLPLLGLFTGARLGELAQLNVSDIQEKHGRWIVHITREGGRSTKTKGSQRVIPLHPELEKLGFLALHAAAKGRGQARLFPEIVADARENLSGKPSREYGRYLKRIGVKVDKTINFHSFRHGLADALRRGGVLDEQFRVLLGHTQATTTGRYGLESEGTITARAAMIDAVSFPGLDLSHLYPAS